MSAASSVIVFQAIFLKYCRKPSDWCTLHDAEYMLAAVAIRSIKNGRDNKGSKGIN